MLAALQQLSGRLGLVGKVAAVGAAAVLGGMVATRLMCRCAQQQTGSGGKRSALALRVASEVAAAVPRVSRVCLRTPLCVSDALASDCGAAAVGLKLESEQVTGSFKARGAANRIGALSAAERCRGVVTASTGNHALATAHAVRTIGSAKFGSPVAAEVFVPQSIAPVKLEAIRRTGVSVSIVNSSDCADSEAAALAEAKAKGKVFVSPYNDLHIAAGQGTVAVELLSQVQEQMGGVDMVLVPVGGGGLISGIAAHIKATCPAVQVVGCQPRSNCCMYDSVRADRILGDGEWRNDTTLADGVAGGIEVGSLTFDLCRQLVDRWVLVSEEEILTAMASVLHHHHKVIEGAAGCAVGALQRLGQAGELAGKRVAVVCCGGNVGSARVAQVADRACELERAAAAAAKVQVLG